MSHVLDQYIAITTNILVVLSGFHCGFKNSLLSQQCTYCERAWHIRVLRNSRFSRPGGCWVLKYCGRNRKQSGGPSRLESERIPEVTSYRHPKGSVWKSKLGLCRRLWGMGSEDIWDEIGFSPSSCVPAFRPLRLRTYGRHFWKFWATLKPLQVSEVGLKDRIRRDLGAEQQWRGWFPEVQLQVSPQGPRYPQTPHFKAAGCCLWRSHIQVG